MLKKDAFPAEVPYVNHIGLIIFLIGAMLRFVPGMYVDETLWVREGETAAIPGTDGKYYLKNNQFSVETYNSKTEKRYLQMPLTESGTVEWQRTFKPMPYSTREKGKLFMARSRS